MMDKLSAHVSHGPEEAQQVIRPHRLF
jgi:hypothetical protein